MKNEDSVYIEKPKRSYKGIVLGFIMIVVAFIFLIPVILAFLNSFKSSREIELNVASLPRFRVIVPKKITEKNLNRYIINRLSEKSDIDLIKSSYTAKNGRKGELFYILNKTGKEKKSEIKNVLKKTGTFETAFVSTVRNYKEAWVKSKFLIAFIFTVIITLVSVFGIVIVSSMAAYIMARKKWHISWFFFIVFVFAMVVPFQAIMFPLVKTADALNLLSTLHGIILIYIGVGCPLAIFMYHGFIKTIPIELEESASIDGANQFVIFFRIVLPLLTPITATIVILDVLWIWNDFLLPLIILLDNKIRTIQIAQYLTRGQFNRDIGQELASLVLAVFPVMIFYFFMQRYIIEGLTSGAVKG